MIDPTKPGLGARHLVQHLQAENQRLQQTALQQQQILLQRAEPMAVAVLDVLEHWCNVAEQPGHPAQAAAAGLLKRWIAANRRAESAAASIVVATNLPKNGSA